MYTFFYTEKSPDYEAKIRRNQTKHKYETMKESNKLFPFVYENKHNPYASNTIKMQKVRKLNEFQTKIEKTDPMCTEDNYYDNYKYLGETLSLSTKTDFNTQGNEDPRLAMTSTPLRFMTKQLNHHRRDSRIENKLGTNTAKMFGDLINFVDDLDLDTDTVRNTEECQENTSHQDWKSNTHNNPEGLFLTKIIQNSIIKKASSTGVRNKEPLYHSTGQFGQLPIAKGSTKKSGVFTSRLGSKYITSTPALEDKYIQFKEKEKDKRNFINHISSFEKKVNQQLSTVMKGYGKNENHIKFCSNPLVNKIYTKMPNFETYKNLKTVESKSSHNYKFRLAPLKNNKRVEKYDRLGANMYYYTSRT